MIGRVQVECGIDIGMEGGRGRIGIGRRSRSSGRGESLGSVGLANKIISNYVVLHNNMANTLNKGFPFVNGTPIIKKR